MTSANRQASRQTSKPRLQDSSRDRCRRILISWKKKKKKKKKKKSGISPSLLYITTTVCLEFDAFSSSFPFTGVQ
jgi:hypothetical protein